MSSTASTSQTKLCSKCGRDITHDRRLKDGQGHYWCTDCGVPGDLAGTSSGLISPCPKCHAPTHATQMIRKDGIYVCIACASGAKRGRKGSGVHAAVHHHVDKAQGVEVVHHHHEVASDEDAAKRKKIILAVCMMVGGGVCYYLMNYVLLV